MAYLQASTTSLPPLRIEPFGGMDTSGSPTQISNHQSPDMKNFCIDEKGALTKRTGYERVFSNSLGQGAIRGMFHFQKSNGATKLLFVHNGALYESDTPNGNLTVWQTDDLTHTWESEVQYELY